MIGSEEAETIRGWKKQKVIMLIKQNL